MTPQRTNPNKSLPISKEKISINDFNKQLDEKRSQAEQLARKANSIWRKFHAEDEIHTDVYEYKDFLKKDEISIPDEVQELFDKAAEAVSSKGPSEEAKDIQKQVEKLNEQENKEEPKKFEETDVTKHPILSKLYQKFGVKEKDSLYVEKEINGIKFTFQYPNSMSANFALAMASGEGIGSMDFAHNIEYSQVAMSIVSMDGIPCSEVWGISNQFKYDNMPPKVRKLCGVKNLEMLDNMEEDKAELIVSFYRNNIGIADTKEYEEIAELECSSCGSTKDVTLVNGEIPVRFCELCGTKMIPTNTTHTDNNVPLA
jgi:hypothetical protein